jgi:outer membrane protein
MRLVIRAALIAAALVGPVAGGVAAQAAPKLAYINSQRLLSDAPGRAEAEATFQKELQTYQAQVKRMGDSLRTMVEAYEKAASTLSPAAREERQKAIRTKEQEFQQRTNQLDQRAGARQDSLTRPILDRIQKAIEAERAAGGYAMIFDAGSQAGVLVAADKSLDITEKVLARLRTMESASTAGAPSPAGPAAAPAGATRPKTPPRD